jgi:hypothetical protein
MPKVLNITNLIFYLTVHLSVGSCRAFDSPGGPSDELGCIEVEGAGSICLAPFERDVLKRIRESMPVQSHRRSDIYYR